MHMFCNNTSLYVKSCTVQTLCAVVNVVTGTFTYVCCAAACNDPRDMKDATVDMILKVMETGLCLVSL